MQIHVSTSSFLHHVPSRELSCPRRRFSCIVSKEACRPRCLTSTAQSLVTLPLTAQDITPEAFAPFGQVIEATDDGKNFDDTDAALKLDLGTPRFYIMHLPRRGMTFDRITYHANVTQCLGGLNPASWYLGVAAPSGSVQNAPAEQDLHAFKIPAGTFVKLHQGTWHAGPLFQEHESMNFYNLELSDTNQVDHNTHVYSHKDGLQFEVIV